MYCIQYIGYVRVYMLSRPHHDNHKFMCLQNAVTILHKNYLFVKCCDNFIKVFHKQINQCADFMM
jgi:hypothetical protein